MKKKLIFAAAALAAATIASACGGNTAGTTTAATEAATEAAAETAAAVENRDAKVAEAGTIDYADAFSKVSEDAPIYVDEDNQAVYYLCEVNGKYFDQPTRHGIVYKGGSNGEKAVLRGLGDEKEFYNALAGFGWQGGENLTIQDNKAKPGEGKSIEGDKLNCTVYWDGAPKAYGFSEIIKSDEVRPFDLRFGGNLKNAQDKNTGCVLCLDSCSVGITSDASYVTNEIEGAGVNRYGNADVLPEDGTKVVAVFTKAE